MLYIYHDITPTFFGHDFISLNRIIILVSVKKLLNCGIISRSHVYFTLVSIVMIQLNNLSLTFGKRSLLKDVSTIIKPNERIGLVGLNGSGKSTLLNMVAGHQKPNNGTITVSRGTKLAYMPQQVTLNSQRPVLDETVRAHKELAQFQAELISSEKVLENHPGDEQALEKYAHAQGQIANLNPALIKAKAQEILMGLGFNISMLNQSVDTLSTGWRMRVVLAQLLLQNADFYLFDEPTNHLDIFAKDWFLSFLKASSFGFLLVCHDRYFLEQACSSIVEIDQAKLTRYNGNYSYYEEQKEITELATIEAYKRQQQEILKKKRTIARFRASASKAKMAQSMMKELGKMKLIELPHQLRETRFPFGELKRAGDVVLTVKGVSHSFNDKKIFDGASFQIHRGDKIALVAPNGKGKTTLLHIITGFIERQTGTINFGHSVTPSIFHQDADKTLNLSSTVIDEVTAAAPNRDNMHIRRCLGAFLFSGDDADKRISVLSGGEKNRVGMAKTLLQDANFLILDEPTNHLDIPSKQRLLKALQEYPGTILFVSHDRTFVNDLATHIIELTGNATYTYHGNYEDFLLQKNLQTERSSGTQEDNSTRKKQPAVKQDEPKVKPKQTKAARILEREIHNVERTIKKIHRQFEQLEYGTDAFIKAQQSLKVREKELKEKLVKWEVIQADLDQA